VVFRKKQSKTKTCLLTKSCCIFEEAQHALIYNKLLKCRYFNVFCLYITAFRFLSVSLHCVRVENTILYQKTLKGDENSSTSRSHFLRDVDISTLS